nr:hypothetical protein [Tanacetum cinerariifolium]
DEAFARQLEAELNVNINWNVVIEQVKREERQDNAVMRYQALKRKPLTEAQARKNMMIYLKNMVGFKIDFFNGMTYIEIRPIFEKHYSSIQAFLEKEEEEVTVQEKRQATPLASKVPVVDHQIYHENNKPYYKKADSTHQLFLSFITLLKNFDREDLEKGIYGLAKVKSWKLFESCGVYIITLKTTQMTLLVEKKYPLTHFTLQQTLDNVRLEVKEESEMPLELLRKCTKGLVLLVEELVLLVLIDDVRKNDDDAEEIKRLR